MEGRRKNLEIKKNECIKKGRGLRIKFGLSQGVFLGIKVENEI